MPVAAHRTARVLILMACSAVTLLAAAQTPQGTFNTPVYTPPANGTTPQRTPGARDPSGPATGERQAPVETDRSRARVDDDPTAALGRLVETALET